MSWGDVLAIIVFVIMGVVCILAPTVLEWIKQRKNDQKEGHW